MIRQSVYIKSSKSQIYYDQETCMYEMKEIVNFYDQAIYMY